MCSNKQNNILQLNFNTDKRLNYNRKSSLGGGQETLPEIVLNLLRRSKNLYKILPLKNNGLII